MLFFFFLLATRKSGKVRKILFELFQQEGVFISDENLMKKSKLLKLFSPSHLLFAREFNSVVSHVSPFRNAELLTNFDVIFNRVYISTYKFNEISSIFSFLLNRNSRNTRTTQIISAIIQQYFSFSLNNYLKYPYSTKSCSNNTARFCLYEYSK